MSVYWDTSVVLKLYVEESDSGKWRDTLTELNEPLFSSELLKMELAFSLAQKEQRGELLPNGGVCIFDFFLKDLAEGRYSLFPLHRPVFSQGYTLAFSNISGQSVLRTLDGIHLATALHHGFKKIATADVRLAEAAEREGLVVL